MLNESNESCGSHMTEAERASYKAKERLALHVLQDVATMLHSMHESGYVHGDIKVDNIMVSPLSSADLHQKNSSQTATTQQQDAIVGGGGTVQGGANTNKGAISTDTDATSCYDSGATQGANKDTTASCPAGYTISLIDLGHTVKMGKTSCGTYEVRVRFSSADVTYSPLRFKSYSKHFRPLTLCPPMLHNSTCLPLT